LTYSFATIPKDGAPTHTKSPRVKGIPPLNAGGMIPLSKVRSPHWLNGGSIQGERYSVYGLNSRIEVSHVFVDDRSSPLIYRWRYVS